MNRLFFLIATGCMLCLPLMAQDRAEIVAHRGYWQSRGSAQNSVAALEGADRIRVYGSEFDVHLTADNVLVVHHDATVEGVDIQKSPYAAIKDIALANGEKVPTLREYLEAAKRTNMRLVFELKSHATPERNREAARIAVESVKEKKLMHRTEFITFNIDAGKEFVRLAPEADVYYLSGDLPPDELKRLGFAGLDYHYDVMRKHPEWFGQAKALGLGINVWTVNDTTLMREMIDAGADFITTDIPHDALIFVSSPNR
ncbi:MAG: glycerophosphodiester phosphodiesterase [Tannerella sp.]|jgi:glycerophosphoryl diester phosphodiesterase|nr:glycerophosphodiester phosphodiesterase [Tannerella sp.]